MTKTIRENRSRDFFKEIKKTQHQSVCSPIHGYVESSDIAKHFAEKYNVLYNSVPSDDQTMKRVREYINIYSEQCSEGERIVSEMDISKAIIQLKFNKSDSDDMGLMSNHIIHSSEMFKKSLDKMFTAVLTHKYQPQTVLLANYIASIPKYSRGNICSGSNYRVSQNSWILL